MTSSQLEVAYLVSEYPLLSHTFIEREIAGLRALGVRVDTFTVRQTPPAGLISAAMRDEATTTTALLANKRALLTAAARLLRRHAPAVCRAAVDAAHAGEARVRSRTRQLFYLIEAVRLHEELVKRGLRHLHVHFANNGADVARLVVAIGEAVDGSDAGWRWTMTMHGPTEFEAVERFDLAAKVTDAAAVACISDFTRSQLMRLVDPSVWSRLSVVRMSVDTDRYHPSQTAVPSGPLRVLNVGRLVPEKGVLVLLDAVEELVETGCDVQLTVVGSGPLEHQLLARLSSTRLGDAVTLLGSVSQDRLPDIYRAHDVFCLPSFQEGLPVVLMEAMATGLPVVTTAIAGIPELVLNDVNGLVVAPGRAAAVARALTELASDPARRRAMGHRGRAQVEAAYSSDVTAEQQRLFLASVAGAGKVER